MITHTTRHLRRALMSALVRPGGAPPLHVCVSCDNDLAEVRDLVQGCSAEFAARVLLVQRPHTGLARCAQVRNNAVRALLDVGVPSGAWVVVQDGDCCSPPGHLEAHARLSALGDVVVSFRHDLTPEQTEALDESAMLKGRWPIALTVAQRAAAQARARRYRRQAFLRRLGLAKSHKPKTLGANHSTSLATYLAVNGHDEAYEGYGQEDDDFGRRVYRAGGRPVVGVLEAAVLHNYHPTRASPDWHAMPGAARFAGGRGGPAACARGLRDPAPQDRPVARLFDGGRLLSERAVPEPAP